jgi:hypothetical protein
MTSEQFENFLREEERHYCQFRCEYRHKSKIKIYTDDDRMDCPTCEENIDVDGQEVEVNVCDYCKIEDFIRELRDSYERRE